jgi:TonB family protein
MSNVPASDDDDEPGFFAKFRVPIVLFALVAIAAGTWFVFFKKADKPKKKAASISMVNIMPPPPPPPTPPPTPPPPQPEQEQKEETKQEFVEETKPEAAPEPESAPDEAPLGTNLEGPGSDSFGLAKGGGGGMIGGTGKGKGGGGSKFGFYAGQVQSRVADALRSHKKTRSASLSVKVRIWVDSTGRITNAKLSGSSGDAAVDRAICDEILTGLQLQSPPPEGMPMPVVMRISATRPN